MHVYQPLTIVHLIRTLLVIGVCLLFTGCGPRTPAQRSPTQPSAPKIHPTIAPELRLNTSEKDWAGVIATSEYKQLPEITLSVDTTPLVTPERAGAPIPIEVIPTNAVMRILGSDQDSAWLLILHDGVIGWVPAFYAHTRLSGLTLPVVANQSAACSSFVAVNAESDYTWKSSVSGNLRAQGLIYRPQPTASISDTELLLISVDGTGSAGTPALTHLEIDGAGELLQFAVNITGLDLQSKVHVQIPAHTHEPLVAQVAFFQNGALKAGEEVNGTVTATSSLNVRRGPGTTYKSIGKLKRGATFSMKGWARDAAGDIWWLIETEAGLSGWVHSSFVQEDGPAECVPEIIDLPPVSAASP